MPLFMMPLALVGLASVPALAAIYWLRNRYRRQVVSSLILWLDQREAREGGRRLQRVQTPLVFFLELLALLGLTLAATDPRLPLAQDRRPVIVVLDDSYSMQAGGDDSPRQRALAAMRKGLGEGSTARFILAGAQPQVMGDPIEVGQASESLLGRWRCESARADLGRAVALAGELGGPRARVLVLTDHAPTDEEAVRGRVRWLAFGQPRPNLAFVNAVRSAHADGQRVLLELANLADTPASTKLSLGSQQRTLELMPGQTQRFWFDVSQDQAPFHASLGNADALAIDNTVTLLPEAERKLRVRLAISDADLQRLVRGALEATGRVELVEFGPELLVTDRDETLSPSPECWLARLIVEEEADAFLGPFVLDRAHPLTQGLILDGVIWAAQQDWETPGMPVIAAGNTPLVTDVEHSDGRHDLRIRVQPKLSTLQDTPNFPALWWNLVDWRLAHTPGLRRANVRLGGEAQIALERGVTQARVTDPHGRSQDLPAGQGALAIRAESPGIYRVALVRGEETTEGSAATREHRFAVNALSQEESDLRAAASGAWGDWVDEEAVQTEYRSVAWAVLLAVLAVLLLHALLLAREGGRRL